jgi:integrase
MTALDLDGGWISYARPKTGIARRCPLWPETIAALREWLQERPAPKVEEHETLVFTTIRGASWGKEIADNPISKETRKLLDKLEINGHRNFYCLRHTFQTIGDDARDFLAVRHIMGHADSDISSAYRERVSDERLRAITNHVHSWLFDKTEK